MSKVIHFYEDCICQHCKYDGTDHPGCDEKDCPVRDCEDYEEAEPHA